MKTSVSRPGASNSACGLSPCQAPCGSPCIPSGSLIAQSLRPLCMRSAFGLSTSPCSLPDPSSRRRHNKDQVESAATLQTARQQAELSLSPCIPLLGGTIRTRRNQLPLCRQPGSRLNCPPPMQPIWPPSDSSRHSSGEGISRGRWGVRLCRMQDRAVLQAIRHACSAMQSHVCNHISRGLDGGPAAWGWCRYVTMCDAHIRGSASHGAGRLGFQ